MSGVEVIGGEGGVEVQYDELAAAAAALQETARELAAVALSARTVLLDPDLIASSVLDPAGFARVECAVGAAVAGPHGLLAAAGRLEGRSLSVREAVARYALADRLGAGVRQVRQWAEGVALAAALPFLPFAALSPLGLAVLTSHKPSDAESLLTEHPGVVEDLAGAAPSFLDVTLTAALGPAGIALAASGAGIDGHRLLSSSVEDAAGLIALLYPAGSPVVVGRGTDRSAPPAPRSVSDLLLALQHRDAQATGDAQGEIDVRRLNRHRPDGTVATSWVVDLPGTKQWQVDPRHRDHLNDLATNLTTMAGDPTPRLDGLTRALELAGVGRDEPVMLVGHSQGGLVAMRAAEDYTRSGRFTVTHVVTAGSPTARMAVPPSVSVLSLENRFDVVPQLDGAPPPPEANRVTAVFDLQTGDIGANHALASSYLAGARAVDADVDDPSLVAWREGAAAFLPPGDVDVAVRTTVWDIRNGG